METFENGAARSEKRPWYRLIPREALQLVAGRFQLGAEKYTEQNWKKGGPDFFNEAMNHVTHHWFAYMNNDESEESNIDNLAAALWGMCALAWWELTGKAKWQAPAEQPPVVHAADSFRTYLPGLSESERADITVHDKGYITDKDRP
jgi:hypothetical protein